MCNFLSGIVLKNGDVITSEYTDSHDLIAEANGLKERSFPKDMGWIKVEYTSDNLLDINTYELRVDETDTPAWFDDAMRESVAAKMHRIAQKCILTEGEIPILLGGKWVLGGTANVKRAVCVNIHSLWGNSRVGELRENSRVGELRENSRVGVLRENSRVGELRENSQVGVLRENSQVGELWENSRVGELWENSRVGVLWGNSRVGVLRENSQIENDYREKK
jgi:hypothetical protein